MRRWQLPLADELLRDDDLERSLRSDEEPPIPVPPGEDLPSPVKEPPDGPLDDPPAPVQEPGPDAPRRL